MQKWEYHVADGKQELNRLGEAGWEAVGVVPVIKTSRASYNTDYGDVKTDGFQVLLKRSKS